LTGDLVAGILAPRMDVGLVCDSCSAFSPMGAFECVRCGTPISLDPRSRTNNPVVENDEGDDGFERRSVGDVGTPCPTCGALVTMGHRFCFNCGTRMPELEFSQEQATKVRGPLDPGPAALKKERNTLFFGAMQAARAKLTLIRGDGLDGVSFTLAGDEHLAGREDVPLLFPDDPFLSPIHANFFYREGQLVVSDEGSVNGVYVRIVGGIEVPFGTRFLVGEQVLEIQMPGIPSDEAEGDGTYYFASPRRPALFRVVQTLRGGDLGRAVQAEAEVVTIGREGNDIDFPEDPFISGQHAQVRWSGGKLTLTDLSSRNGTFVRIAGEQSLHHGDYVFMGQQLLRVEIV
jgi:pSer/pThr/pTyr-binding forkhead associated (FHA) protein